MNEVQDLHLKAMSFVDEAHLAKIKGELDAYSQFTLQAYECEAEAAWKLAGQLNFEPTRSVLFRSAASLALEINKSREAEQLISAALAGTPPDEIADELRDLLENVYFSRHLDLRGITLSPGELQMTIDGDAVGFGIAKSESFVQRLKDFEKLLYRTEERLRGKDFREKGRPPKELMSDFELYLSVPRAASFAVTLRLGRSTQLALPGLDFQKKTLDNLLNALEVFAHGNLQELEELIPDEAYRTNFIGLAERLAPDGEQVKTVGFTAGTQNHESERRIALTTTKAEIREKKKQISTTIATPVKSVETQFFSIQGTLLEADATRNNEGIIEIVDDQETSHRIIVPRGMMSDIVKPMFEEMVDVAVKKTDNKLHLISIDKLDRPAHQK